MSSLDRGTFGMFDPLRAGQGCTTESSEELHQEDPEASVEK
jgi:hypothetical protein